MQQPLRPPEQRVAKRNARKEKLVKCVLATRCRRHPRRGNQLSSLCGTPPRPSDSPRKPAGTLSRRPSHSNFARMCKVATKAVFSFGPCTARFLFHKMEKKMGGASPLDKPPAGAEPLSIPAPFHRSHKTTSAAASFCGRHRCHFHRSPWTIPLPDLRCRQRLPCAGIRCPGP